MSSHPVDVHVGIKLRSRRTLLGMSQEELGESVGVTFQQIQKYERGINRIGSSRLYQFSCSLGVSVAHFFEDYDGNNENIRSFAEDTPAFEYEKMTNKETITLVRSFCGISSPKVRKKILSLVKSLADDEDTIEDESI